MIKICEEFGVKNEIKFNPDKTNLMILGPKRRNQKKLDLTFMGEILEIKRDMKYLGIHIDEKITLNITQKRDAKKSLAAYFLLREIGIDSGVMSSDMKSFLYRTYIRPVLYYGMDVVNFNKNAKKNNEESKAAL